MNADSRKVYANTEYPNLSDAGERSSFERNAGIALIIFSILLLFTMLLHPAGSNVHGLMRMSRTIILIHCIAIASLPLGWIGFWGLTRRIGTNQVLSVLAFAFMSLGLLAALMAATTNGLVLPLYLQGYEDASDEVLNRLQPMLRYGFTINKAFDYMYTSAFNLAIFLWSVEMLRNRRMPVWLGWTSIVLAVVMLIIFFGGLAAVNTLKGLRMFLGGVVLWIFAVGLILLRIKAPNCAKGFLPGHFMRH